VVKSKVEAQHPPEGLRDQDGGSEAAAPEQLHCCDGVRYAVDHVADRQAPPCVPTVGK